uniref:Transmembrane protein n=1 Tax=Cacopsylla melanoneura TaxID=428564 RepID=A0A8D8ZE41_9HEMI
MQCKFSMSFLFRVKIKQDREMRENKRKTKKRNSNRIIMDKQSGSGDLRGNIKWEYENNAFRSGLKLARFSSWVFWSFAKRCDPYILFIFKTYLLIFYYYYIF